MNIMVVDDDIGMRALLGIILQRRGHNVLVADSGSDVLQTVQQRPVDLVITDLMMPDMDGYELIATLRQNYDSDELPIIVLSAISSASELRRSIDLGANITLTKPITANTLEGAIASMFN